MEKTNITLNIAVNFPFIIVDIDMEHQSPILYF